MLPSFGSCGLLLSTLLAASLPFAHGLPNPAALANPAILHDYSIKPRQVNTTNLPIVNLGYAKHQAQSLQTIGNVSYYVFKNVRFAAPPLGERRFRVPAPPLKEEGVQNGVFPGSTACAQGLVAQGVAGQPGISLPIPGLDQLTIGSEDCLFLDVFMPTGIDPRRPLPVLLNYYGGAYALGNKEGAGNPAALYNATGEKFVYVAPNYRLGAFGWLAPKDQDWDSNIGLHDARAASDWVKNHISKFGGNPRSVTAMGLSAGAGLIANLLVSRGPPLGFQRAILQSAGWAPELSRSGATREPLFRAYLQNANCSDVACIRAASTTTLQRANLNTLKQFNSGALGTLPGFFPVPDGNILLDNPPNLLKRNQFHREVTSIIMSSARNEAGTGAFTFPRNATDAYFEEWISKQYTTNEALVKKLAQLYPPVQSSPTEGSSGFQRFTALFGDANFNCHTYYTLSAYGRSPFLRGRKYIFNMPPASHGSDAGYTWYGVPTLGSLLPTPPPSGGNNTGSPPAPNPGSSLSPPVTRPDLALEQQEWTADYVQGRVNLKNWPEWKSTPWGGEKALWLNETGLAVGDDYYADKERKRRCDVLRDEIFGKDA